MLELPISYTFSFVGITLFAFVLFLSTMWKSKSERVQKRLHPIALLTLAWIIFQSTLSLNGWYMDRKAMPPHLIFPIISAVIGIVLLFVTGRGRRFIDGLSESALTWIHVVRLPVELSLYALALAKQVPWSMTYYGHNFDIVFGISAPLVAFAMYSKKWMSHSVFLGWNILGIISLLIIVITAIGAAPSPLQMWDFERPNYAVLHFPFSWLPSFIVPLVLLSHLILIRKCLLTFRATKRAAAVEDQLPRK